MKKENPIPELLSPAGSEEALHAAVDSGGAQYGRAGFDEFAAYRDYFCRTYAGGPGIGWYEVRLELPDGEVPDWVEIPIGCGGCLRVNLAEGVVTE